MIAIYSKFNSLKPAKQERIINAALKEFARNGYEKASTNEMVKEADISKGSLFSYFKSKKDLYLFLFDYVTKVIDKIYEEADWSETDFFLRMKDLGLVKYKIMRKFPQVFDFLKSVSQEDAAEVKSDIQRIRQDIVENGLERGYQNIDFSKFREDIDIQKTLNIISWTMLSFAEEQRNRVDSYENLSEDLLSEWDDYFDIMKRCFYKKEEQ